ncbi:MAG: phosphohistidine phosphatase SixA [Gammaproteobacteria bacterium]|nr:MAG: phosphohistidine phosphatase SixA [Gammaproteobacteria bacterium]
MQIFIMRHGEAANVAGKDSLRPLTKQGLFEAEKMGIWLAQTKLSFTNVFVSPYLRAQQTCAKVINTFTKATLCDDACFEKLMLETLTPETLDFITPSGNARQAHDFLDGLFQKYDAILNGKDDCTDEEQAILLVSHMPFVSYLVAELTGSLHTPMFSTGAIVVIDYDIKQMQGRLIELVSPARLKT